MLSLLRRLTGPNVCWFIQSSGVLFVVYYLDFILQGLLTSLFHPYIISYGRFQDFLLRLKKIIEILKLTIFNIHYLWTWLKCGNSTPMYIDAHDRCTNICRYTASLSRCTEHIQRCKRCTEQVPQHKQVYLAGVPTYLGIPSSTLVYTDVPNRCPNWGRNMQQMPYTQYRCPNIHILNRYPNICKHIEQAD